MDLSKLSLSEKQRLFTHMVGQLIEWLYLNDYEATLGEAYRTPEQAALNARNGTGISNSLHTQRLAIDLNLFKRGQYLNRTSDYLSVGEYWESMGGSWGGRFKTNPDGNHFSLSPDDGKTR